MFLGILDRIEDGSLLSREIWLANLLINRNKPDPKIIYLPEESGIAELKVGQRFNFDGRTYSVRETIQGRWRVAEDAYCHPLFSLFNSVTDRLADFSLSSREERFTQKLNNPKFPKPVRIRFERDFYNIDEKNNRFKYQGRNFTLKVNENNWYVEEDSCNLLYSFYRGIMDRIADGTFRSRAERLSDIIIKPEHRTFQVDLNSTLWYGDLTLDDLHPALQDWFTAVQIQHQGVEKSALASNDLLDFLEAQGKAGARINIASTGKTDASANEPGGALPTLLSQRNFGIGVFQSGDYFQQLAKRENLPFREIFGYEIKVFLKYRLLGKIDRESPTQPRHNILIDDRWYQLIPDWLHSINSEEFGMGSVKDLMQLSSLLYRLDPNYRNQQAAITP